MSSVLTAAPWHGEGEQCHPCHPSWVMAQGAGTSLAAGALSPDTLPCQSPAPCPGYFIQHPQHRQDSLL